MDKQISLILPVFNEEENIERVVLAILDFFTVKEDLFEIILVDDGSTDKTPIITEQLVRDSKHLKVVHHSFNRGYGAALASGFKEARYGTIAFMDSDGQFDISELGKLLTFNAENDIVAGYRLKRRDPFHRVMLGAVYSCLVYLTLGVNLKDINCGLKVFRKSMLDRIKFSSTGALIHAEILVKAKKMGCSVKEVGVTHFPRLKGRQTGASFRVILKATYELGRLLLERRPGRRAYEYTAH